MHFKSGSLCDIHKNLTENILQNNPVWTQLLGLCPLLAVSNTVANARIGTSKQLRFDFKQHAYIYPAIANSRFHAITLLRANNFHVYNSDSSRSRSFRLRDLSSGSTFHPDHSDELCNFGESKRASPAKFIFSSFLDAVGTSIGFAIAIITLGFAREILGNGTLFENLWLLTGNTEDLYTILLFDSAPFPVASLPPGAFLVAGLLLAASKAIYNSKEQPSVHE